MPISPLGNKNWSDRNWRENKTKHFSKGGTIGHWRKNNALASYFSVSKKSLAIYAAATFGVAGLIGFSWLFWITKDLPDPNRLMDRQIAQSTKIFDRTGENLLYEIHGDEKRTMISLGEIPDHVKQATVAVEDKDFYKHKGFSLWAIFRTVIKNVVFGQKAGGSTLTQQFIKNAVLTTEKTYTRKIKEVVLAYKVEKKFSKDEILQMYFNEIPYGSTAYGVEAASRKYFGKSVREVTLAEGAILAALPQAPSRYSPYGSHKDLLFARQQFILDLMVKQGHISQAEADAAKDAPIKFKESAENIVAPHFVMYVKEILTDKYGDKAVEQEGLKIYTTLDLYKQKAAEEAIAGQVEKNEKKYKASNAALVSIDPKTGQILAMVGSKDYFNDEIDGQVNIATRPLQPGSSMKPIVYAASFIKGYSPNTVLYDVVTNFSTDPAKPYEPRNYNGKEYGPVTIRKALAGSLNIPAVKTIYLTGIDKVLELTKGLGYTTLNDKSRFGLSLVLGGGEVKLLEHTNAFSAFAREGEIRPVAAILKVEDKNGKILEEYKEQKTKVFEPNVARMINDIMTDNASRAYIFGEKNHLTLPGRPVAAKTGTTNDNRDAWTVGYTPSIVTGVWVGNNDHSEMKVGADGSVVAAPIWNAYMKKVLGDTPVEEFKKPEIKMTGKPMLDGVTDGGTTIKIDRASGLLATADTPESFIEEKIFTQPHSILYYIDKDDPLGGAPANPAQDPQFELWESRVQKWAASSSISTSTPPTEYDNLHKSEYRPTLRILSPGNKQTVSNPVLSVSIDASAIRGIGRVEYYLNHNLAFTNSSYPFNLNQDISFLKNGFHTLTVRACDDIDNCSSQDIEINLSLSRNAGSQPRPDVDLSWYSPVGDVAVSSLSFPLALGLNTSNPGQAAKIIYYYYPAEGGDPKFIAPVAPVTDGPNIALWKKPPAPGSYKVYGVATDWNGQTFRSAEVIITID